MFATDHGSPALSGSSTVTVYIDDINDNSPVIYGDYNTTISEAVHINTVVFTIHATDDDAGVNADLHFAITNGNVNHAFAISRKYGIIQIGKALDRETTNIYYLEVTVKDGGSVRLSSSCTATVIIEDENDNSPSSNNPNYEFTVLENVPSLTYVGTVNASDADTGDNSDIVYSIELIWKGSKHFAIDNITGDIVTVDAIDREVISIYSFLCRISDRGIPQLATEVNVTIHVTDLNDHEPVFSSSSYKGSILEGCAIGTSVLSVFASDADTGENGRVVYIIHNRNGSEAEMHFNIESSGKITVKTVIDREKFSEFEFSVVASDNGTIPNSQTATVIVSIQDVNDNKPYFDVDYYNWEIPFDVDSTCPLYIGTVHATDADDGSNGEVRYFFVANSYPAVFRLDPDLGKYTIYYNMFYS